MTATVCIIDLWLPVQSTRNLENHVTSTGKPRAYFLVFSWQTVSRIIALVEKTRVSIIWVWVFQAKHFYFLLSVLPITLTWWFLLISLFFKHLTENVWLSYETVQCHYWHHVSSETAKMSAGKLNVSRRVHPGDVTADRWLQLLPLQKLRQIQLARTLPAFSSICINTRTWNRTLCYWESWGHLTNSLNVKFAMQTIM